MAKIKKTQGEAAVAEDLNAMLRSPDDAQAVARVSGRDPYWSAILRTTCVATMLDGGHATNALPQRARANINCRIFPGTPTEAVRAKLAELVADPEVQVISLEGRIPSVAAPPLTAEIMAPVEKLAAEFWPDVPVLPILLVGGSDTRLPVSAHENVCGPEMRGELDERAMDERRRSALGWLWQRGHDRQRTCARLLQSLIGDLEAPVLHNRV
jgi:acetylornithine deacetylase/succinyl-diaminopimelate desuccinylase-like protein